MEHTKLSYRDTYPAYAESLLDGIADTIIVSITGDVLHIVLPEILAVVHQSRDGQERAQKRLIHCQTTRCALWQPALITSHLWANID